MAGARGRASAPRTPPRGTPAPAAWRSPADTSRSWSRHRPAGTRPAGRRHRVDRLVAAVPRRERGKQDPDAEVEAVHDHVGEHGEQDQHRPDGDDVDAHRPAPGSAMRSAGPGVMPAVRIGPSSPSGAGSCTCTSLAISRRMYQVPKPNTMKYTTMKASSEAPTAGAASGEALSAVVIRL